MGMMDSMKQAPASGAKADVDPDETYLLARVLEACGGEGGSGACGLGMK